MLLVNIVFVKQNINQVFFILFTKLVNCTFAKKNSNNPKIQLFPKTAVYFIEIHLLTLSLVFDQNSPVHPGRKSLCLRGCSHIMSAKNGGSRPPPSPPCQPKIRIWLTPLSPLSEKIRNWLTPPTPCLNSYFDALKLIW